jgi:hypothetical protein
VPPAPETEGTPDIEEAEEDPDTEEDPDIEEAEEAPDAEETEEAPEDRPAARRFPPVSRRSHLPPAVPGLKAMTAARQANGTAGST